MQDSDLVRMANQISTYFQAYGHDKAVAGTADHIRAFWDPRMRRRIVEYETEGGEGLSPVAREAISMLRGDRSAA